MRAQLFTPRRLAVGIGAVAVLGAGGGAYAANRGGAPSVSSGALSPPVAYVTTTTSSSAPVAPSEAVAQAMASMSGGDVVAARIGSPPSDAPPLNGSPVVPALYVTVKAPSMQDGEALEARWQADLLEGDVVELAGSSTSLKNDIGYEYVTADLPDGSMVPMGGGMGDIARGESFPGSQETDQDVENTIASAVAASGLTLDDIQILHAPGPAPAVVVTSPDVAALAPDFRTLLSDLFGASPQCEGYYLEIRDPGGTPEVRTSASFVTGSGGMWINSSLASSWQVPH